MKTITAILKQRNDDYHISVENHPEIWDCGKTLKQAIDAFKRTIKTCNLKVGDLKVNIGTITEITWI